MQRGRPWLSEDALALALADERAQQGEGKPPTFDVVVIGSGYGGAVAAARLSALAEAPGRAPMRVAVLERGAEYVPGSFPDRFSDLVGHQRLPGANPLGAPANPEGLFDWHLDGDVGALVANGLGGGSLINAGVCEPAQPAALAATEGLLLDRGWLQRIARPRADRLGLALGACRQRPLLTDRPLADAAMGVLLAALDGPAPAAHAPIDLVLLAGDQVYADTRVDTGHTGAQRRQYFEAHHEAWSAPHQREVLRRRPVVMALDDHEFRNDDNNRIAAGRPQEVHAAATAWQRYQLAAGPRQPEVHPALPGAELKAAWRAFRQCGFAVFVCDTRSERADTSRVDRRGAKLMSDLQMAALQDWLLTLQHDPAYGDRPKVVVTGGLYSPYPFANATRGEWLDGAEARGLRAGDTTWGYTITASTPGSGWTRLTLGADGQVQADFVAVLPPAT